MCPFILQDADDEISTSTNFLVLTTARFYENFTKDVVAYAKKLGEATQSILLFDGSLGLGDLDFANKMYNSQNIEAVLMKQKALSILIRQDGGLDWISGFSKKINLGGCSSVQLHNLLEDLKILGKNYQNVLIYAPPTLPQVQNFFCNQLNSLCFINASEDNIAATMNLMDLFPHMKCYLNTKEKYLKVSQSLQLSEIAQKGNILYNFAE